MSKYCCLTLTSPPMERIWSPLACDLHVLNVFACTTLCIVYHIVSNTHTYTVHFDLVYMSYSGETFEGANIHASGGHSDLWGGRGAGAELWHSVHPAMQGHDHKNYNFAKENFRCQSKNCEMQKDFSFSELFPLPLPRGCVCRRSSALGWHTTRGSGSFRGSRG